MESSSCLFEVFFFFCFNFEWQTVSWLEKNSFVRCGCAGVAMALVSETLLELA